MRKSTLVLLVILFFAAPLFALTEDFEFRDVPEDSKHWAKECVYDLVALGITTGYPDGTFRGKKNIDRYEVAAFMAKFYRSILPDAARQEKLIAELRWELERVKYELADYKKERSKTYGVIKTRYRGDHILLGQGQRGPRADYQLKYSYRRSFGEDAFVKVNFDTNDAGFNTTQTREVALSMLDLAGRFEYGGVLYRAVLGPGSQTFTSAQIGEFEGNEVFQRPKSQISAQTRINGVKTTLSYVAHQMDASGQIGLNEIKADFATFKTGVPLFRKMRLALITHYLFEGIGSSNADDYHLSGEILANLYPHNKVEKILRLGLGTTADFPRGAYVGAELKLKDYFNTGMDVAFAYKKVGSKFREGLDAIDTYDFVGLNYDDEIVLDGKVDVGLLIKQRLTDKVNVYKVYELQLSSSHQIGESHAGTSFTSSNDIEYKFSKNLSGFVYYKIILTPSEVDQFGNATASQKDEVGLRVSYKF